MSARGVRDDLLGRVGQERLDQVRLGGVHDRHQELLDAHDLGGEAERALVGLREDAHPVAQLARRRMRVASSIAGRVPSRAGSMGRSRSTSSMRSSACWMTHGGDSASGTSTVQPTAPASAVTPFSRSIMSCPNRSQAAMWVARHDLAAARSSPGARRPRPLQACMKFSRQTGTRSGMPPSSTVVAALQGVHDAVAGDSPRSSAPLAIRPSRGPAVHRAPARGGRCHVPRCADRVGSRMPVQPRIPDFDVFEVLGVTPDDPPEAVKAAWRRAVKEHHPDTSGGSDEQIKRINVAYEWLRDPTLRQTLLLATGGRPDRRPVVAAGPAAVWPVRPDEPPGQRSTTRAVAPSGSTRWPIRIERRDDGRAAGPGPRLPAGPALVVGLAGPSRRAAGAERARPPCGRSAGRCVLAWRCCSTRRCVRAAYDEELVGQVVSDRLADLVRGIVLLDVLSPDARLRVAAEWDAR